MSRLWPELGFDPLVGLRAMQRELSRLFNRPGTGEFPPINVYDQGSEFVVEAMVPGIGIAELDLTLTGETLEIKGTRATSAHAAPERFRRREREEGSFARTLVLPEAVDADGVKAIQRDGIVTIRLPKSEATQPHRIAVEPR